MIDVGLLLLGLALILVGANCLTDGASAIAKRFGISDLVVGLTIVAFGTSAPEFVVSVMAALNGSAEMAVGNVLGSNLFNLLAIVGCTAMVKPITVGRGTISKEIPLVILSSLLVWVLASDVAIDGGDSNILSRADGLALLAFFCIFMRYTFSIAKDGVEDDVHQVVSMSMPKSVLFIIIGLLGLIFGGQWFVSGASGIARSLGVSEAVIGLTLVAAGTSLPELATSIVAAMKGSTGMAVGNVVGSCLFNIFFILGSAATISPLSIKGIAQSDFIALVIASALLWIFGLMIGDRRITRIEGFVLTACYVGYLAYLVINL